MMIEQLMVGVYIALSALMTLAAHAALRRLGVRRGLPASAWLVLLAGCWAGYTVSGATRADRWEKARSAIMGLAPTYAEELRRLGHARIGLDTPPDDPTYLAIIEAQKKWLEINPAVADIYTYRIVDGQWVLIVDSETDYNRDGLYSGPREGRTPIGEVLSESSGLEVEPFQGRSAFDEVVYTDRWGTWVSAYEPILDEQDRVEAAVGVDYPAGEWLAELVAARARSLVFTLLLMMVFITFAGALSLRGLALRRLREHQDWLETARQAAESANRAKSDFLANMSHEIRTPMTAILGFTEVALESVTDEIVRGYLETVHRNGEHLIELINDILDLSKIESGTLTVEQVPVDLRALATEVCDLLRIRSQLKGVALELELEASAPAWILSDGKRLRQILTNLVGNAIKFTERGRVTIQVCGITGQQAEVQIRDTGVGIAPERLEAVFEPFEQADASTTRRFGGTGLGLTISRRLARLLGGDVQVESQPGVGSVFRVTFDASPTEAPAPLQELRTGGKIDLRGMLILYAEDGVDNQRLIRHHLEKAGATVEVVDDGQAALERHRLLTQEGRTVDLILTDIQMPRLDGLGLARQLRADGCLVPIVALTASAMRGDAEQCFRAGCDGYLSKPVGRDQLLATCSRWIWIERRRAA